MEHGCGSRKGSGMHRMLQELMPEPKILFATSEVAPLAKTGGLADVSASLPKALASLGCEVRLVLPAYGAVLERAEAGRVVDDCVLRGRPVEIREAVADGLPPLWLVHAPELFDRPGNPYLHPDGHDWPDNAERFATFADAIVHLALGATAGFRPNLVHLNDWQTGLAAALLARCASRPPTLFTIHNLNFHGVFDAACFERLDLPAELASMHALEFHGQLSFIKGGLVFADLITTVSPRYAREIQTPEFGCGLDGLLRHRAGDLHGILNGIDTSVWNPATDPWIAERYDAASLARKAVNKAALQDAVGVSRSDAPVIGMVTRLTEQKGIDLVIDALPALLSRDVQLVVLGTGAREYQQALAEAAARNPGRMTFIAAYDEPLAHVIEAGADLFLMPSRFEPCGLNQMYSMVYGTLPIVHRVGGLADTVRPAGLTPGEATTATGFVFAEPTTTALLGAVDRALAWYARPAPWRALQRNAMAQDFSWRQSSARYLELYRRLLGGAEEPEPLP
jgi:starch synthase